MMGFDIEVTTLTNKKFKVNASVWDDMAAVKALITDDQGIPADQQTLWFPSDLDPTADLDLQPASAFPWWSSNAGIHDWPRTLDLLAFSHSGH